MNNVKIFRNYILYKNMSGILRSIKWFNQHFNFIRFIYKFFEYRISKPIQIVSSISRIPWFLRFWHANNRGHFWRDTKRNLNRGNNNTYVCNGSVRFWPSKKAKADAQSDVEAERSRGIRDERPRAAYR